MNRREIRERVEEALQDIENRRWTNSEINRYIDDAQREFVRVSRQPQSTVTVPLVSGSTEPSTGTAAVDGKTVTVTTASAHGLVSGDAVVIGDEAYLITKLTDTTYYFVSNTVVAGSVSYLKIDVSIAVPSAIEEVVSVSLDGINLSIMSEGELNSAVFRFTGGGNFMEGVFGVVPNPFTTIKANYTVNATPRWKERNGPVEAVVFNNASASSFRPFPLPARDDDLFIDPDAETKLFKQIEIRGIPKISDTTDDEAEPIINHYHHEALVFGALERAYNREGQVRNIEKAQLYRARFLEIAVEAKMLEGINSLSRSEGRNESYFRVVR